MTNDEEKMIAELNRIGVSMADVYRRLAAAEEQINGIVEDAMARLAAPIATREAALCDLRGLDLEYALIVRGRKPDPHAAPTLEQGLRWQGMSREAIELLTLMAHRLSA